jgi:hypothetical protein
MTHDKKNIIAELTKIKALVAPDSDIANICGRAIAMAKDQDSQGHGPIQGRKPRVVIESPYAGDTVLHVDYARAALKDSLARGEAPIASHLLLTQVLHDDDPAQRQLGIEAGTSWIAQADLVVFYEDLGCSSGMMAASAEAHRTGTPIEVRYLGGVWAS